MKPGRGTVLVVAPQPFYEDRGTPIAVRQVVEALSELRYEVDVLAFPMGEAVNLNGVTVHRTANPLGIRQVPIGFSMRKLALDASLVGTMARQLRSRRYDCIHAVEEAAFPAVVLGRRAGIPVIYDMQSSLPEQLAGRAFFRLPGIQPSLRRCERWLLERADVVVSSAGLAERVRGMAPGARVREWHFAPARGGSTGRSTLRRDLGIAADAPLILYSGTFEPYQGLDLLVGALNRLRETHPRAVCVLIGALEGGHDVLPIQSAELRRSGMLRVMNRQPRSAIPSLLAEADVLVSPRAWGSNLPLKVFDYLAAGRPIVATDIPTHRTVLDEDRAILVAPTGDAIAAGIAAALDDRSGAEAMATRARTFAEDRLGWLRFVDSVKELYSEAMTSGPREAEVGSR